MTQATKRSSAYILLKQVSIFVTLMGVLLVVGHVVRQHVCGAASLESLVGGAVAFVVGLLFTILASIRIALDRIQDKIEQSGTNPPQGSRRED